MLACILQMTCAPWNILVWHKVWLKARNRKKYYSLSSMFCVIKLICVRIEKYLSNWRQNYQTGDSPQHWLLKYLSVFLILCGCVNKSTVSFITSFFPFSFCTCDKAVPSCHSKVINYHSSNREGRQIDKRMSGLICSQCPQCGVIDAFICWSYKLELS